MYNTMVKTAREIIKGMGDARFIVNDNFDRYMVNFYISDGVNTIAADAIDDYFIVNDQKCVFPAYKSERVRIFALADRFAKNHAYTCGLNPIAG
ncbi:MAG: hypothetical protein IJI57_04760 [Flexilinea sp.]|nr:hypothetical protein [Flexilinea sp.]